MDDDEDVNCGKESVERDIEKIVIYKDLVGLLSTAQLKEDEGLLMDRNNWIRFVNSPVVVKLIFETLMRCVTPM